MKNRERDTQMETLLRMALAGDHRPPSSACLDAEVLAAWADGGLAAPERAAAEAHAAGCAQCQAMMASMVRSLPAETAVDAVRSPLRRWMMFLTPAMAGAVAIAVWIGVGRNAAPPPVTTTAFGGAPAETTTDPSLAVPAERPAEQAPAARLATPQQAAKSSDKRVDELRKAPSPEVLRETAQVASERDRVAVAVTTDPANRMEVKDQKTELATALPAAPAATLPRAAEVQGYIPPQQQANQANQVNQAPNQQATQQANQQAPGMLDAQIAAGRGGREDNRIVATQAARSFFSPAIIAPPNSGTRWRIIGGSRIEHSADSGQTWATQYDAGAGVSLVAGTAVSATVAWMVGGGGVVVVTADGRTWTRTAVPGAPDLTAVTAADALAATVLTADGRRFTTADGGRTWK
jgi:hypothetical protein